VLRDLESSVAPIMDAVKSAGAGGGGGGGRRGGG
jgi:hypothetical protein